MKKPVTEIYGGYGGLCESNIKRDFRIILHTLSDYLVLTEEKALNSYLLSKKSRDLLSF